MARPGVSVERLMQELGGEVSRARRAQMVARGRASAYDDREVFAEVEAMFQRVLDLREHDALLLREMLDDPEDYDLELRLRYASHRPVIGPLIVFVKRKVLLPLTRWLYEYSLENFRRQQRVNRLLIACVEELAIQNARLRKIAGLQEGGIAEREGKK